MGETHSVGPAGPGETQAQPERTLETFWEQWGDVCGLEKGILLQVWHAASGYYVHYLEYHNFDHALDTLWTAMELADHCAAEGAKIDRAALVIGSLLHDADYHYPAESHPTLSKEEHSASIALQFANTYGLDESTMIRSYKAILATASHATPRTIEDKILVRADIHNIGGDFETSFLPNTRLLMKECEGIAKRESHGFDQAHFLTESVVLLSNYLSNDLKLGEFDTEWLGNARFNVNRLIRLAAKVEGFDDPGDFVRGLGSTAVRDILIKSRRRAVS